MEMHDSYLKDWACDEYGHGFALFRACIYRSEGQLFTRVRSENGWQDLRFEFDGMRIEGSLDLSGNIYLSDGDLYVGERRERGIVYLPANLVGVLRMEMCITPSFETVIIHATAMKAELVGEFEHECFWDENEPVAGS